MSFAITTHQVRSRTKTVTRRRGWLFLKPGDLLQPVVKAQGLGKGEHVTRIGGPVRIVSVRREPLNRITFEDVAREGFSEMGPADFAAMFCRHNGGAADQVVTRIEFEYTEPDAAASWLPLAERD